MRFLPGARRGPWRLALLAAAPWLLACQPTADRAAPAPPPVGHYAGTVQLAGRPTQPVALELRHPAPGHYTAELTGPPALRFVADTVAFRNGRLRLVRPGRPGETLDLALDGDFWRGTLRLDSARGPVLLLRRGPPPPTVYRVEEVPQARGSAWLFAPDAGTAGGGLALLPDAAQAPAGALWADALAREGLTVLLLPAADTAGPATTGPLLRAARRLLRNTAGTDTARLGTWASGPRADAVARALAAPDGPQTDFFIVQNATLAADSRAAYRELARRKLPALGLYGGPGNAAAAASLRGALRGRAVRSYPAAGPDLLVPDPGGRTLIPGLPGEVTQWVNQL